MSSSPIAAIFRCLRSALAARGWSVEQNGYVLRMSSASGGPPRFRRLRNPSRSRRSLNRSQPPAAADAADATAEGRRMKRGADQIALPLDWPQTEGESRFIVSDANREAFDHFRKWSMWPVKATILTGPRRSGRTLLARSFVERVGGRCIDQAEQPRRGRGVPRLEPGSGQRPAAGHGCGRGAAGLVAEAARPADPAGGHSGRRPSSSPTTPCSRR